MKQGAVLDGFAFDPFSFDQDGLATPEVDVDRGETVDALVVAPVIVVRDECNDLSFEITGQIIVLEQNSVFERLMLALDFPLRHRMIRRATSVPQVLLFEPFSQVAGDIARAVSALSYGRLSWRPLAFQSERAMSAFGTKRQSVPGWLMVAFGAKQTLARKPG